MGLFDFICEIWYNPEEGVILILRWIKLCPLLLLLLCTGWTTPEPAQIEIDIPAIVETEKSVQATPEPLESVQKTPNRNIPLPIELQEHTEMMCEEYNLDPEILYAVMWHESRMIVNIPDNINSNGTRDRGLCQINEINWNWLSDEGLDVSIPEDNIEAACVILSMQAEKYGLDNGIRAYAVGAGGMRNGGGYNFLNEIKYIVDNEL